LADQTAKFPLPLEESMKRIIPGICLAILCAYSALQAQQPQAKPTLTPVTGPIYLLQGDGGNIGIMADPAGVLMIDSMYERSAPSIREAIKSLPGGDKVRFLINTHWHSDHTEGNPAFGPSAMIFAHDNVRALLEKPQALLGQKANAYPAGALPAVTYSDKLTLHVGNETVRLVHFPNAHSNGDTVVIFEKSKVVHAGDMFFQGMFPFMDVANGGNIENWVRQLDSLASSIPADAKIIPGHGPLVGVAELRAFRQMLFDSADVVRKQMKEGKTLDQIKAAGLPERFAPWTKGFFTTPQWLELVYQSLAK
jgi:glyoxylase-like metal-dependent hydrolase (beta-lactamase superfamily II)